MNLFDLGQIHTTRGVQNNVSAEEIKDALTKHGAGDFGSVDADSIELNAKAIDEKYGDVLSEFTSSKGISFWIQTEVDLHSTTVLLPDEY